MCGGGLLTAGLDALAIAAERLLQSGRDFVHFSRTCRHLLHAVSSLVVAYRRYLDRALHGLRWGGGRDVEEGAEVRESVEKIMMEDEKARRCLRTRGGVGGARREAPAHGEVPDRQLELNDILFDVLVGAARDAPGGRRLN